MTINLLFQLCKTLSLVDMKQLTLLSVSGMFSLIAMAQEPCFKDTLHKFADLSAHRTEFYHPNGIRSARHVHRGRYTMISREWDSCGKLIRKRKSGKTLFRRVPYHQATQYRYYPSGALQQKRFTRIQGCWHVKRSRKRSYPDRKAH